MAAMCQPSAVLDDEWIRPPLAAINIVSLGFLAAVIPFSNKYRAVE